MSVTIISVQKAVHSWQIRAFIGTLMMWNYSHTKFI